MNTPKPVWPFKGSKKSLENSLKAKHHMQENMQANIFANDTYTKNRA